MSVLCKDLMHYLEKLAPETLAEEWDNIGLIVGRYDKSIDRIYITLDVTKDAIKQAIHDKVDLIICHHPPIFKSVSKINTHDYLGKNLHDLIANDISVYCMHTNIDNSKHGLATKLAEMLELKHFTILGKEKIHNDASQGLGRVGELHRPLTFEEFVSKLKKTLNCNVLRYAGDKNKMIRRVAVCPGSGMDLMMEAYSKEVDVYITGDMKYHQAVEVEELGFLVIDAEHFYTEKIFENIIIDYLDVFLHQHKIEISSSFFEESPIKYI